MNIQDFFADIIKKKIKKENCYDISACTDLLVSHKEKIKNFDAFVNNKCVCSIEELMREGCICGEFKKKWDVMMVLAKDRINSKPGKESAKNASPKEAIEKAGGEILQATNEQIFLKENCKQNNETFLLLDSTNIDVIYPENLEPGDDLWEKVNEILKTHYYTIIDVNLLKILEREIKYKTKKESCLLSFNGKQNRITVDFLYKDKIILPKVNAVVPSLITNKNILNLGEAVEDIVYKYVFELITEQTVKKISDEIKEVVGEECKIFPQKRGLKIKFDKLNREFLIL